MSGIGGVFGSGGAPVERHDLCKITRMLERRGPDGSDLWCRDSIGLVHTALVTTPEAKHEHLPLVSEGGALVITADARLDNRDELIRLLGLRDRERDGLGDGELILWAYRKWGERCPEHLLGDFAFAVWDSRERVLFCARDHFGVRPFYYHHSPGHLFAFASEPRAILVLEQVPYRIYEPRIADFLVTQLEGIDKTCTFFEEVYRLPPAHTLTVTPGGMAIRRFWTLEPGPELRLGSHEAYGDAFLEVFREVVRCRMRGPGSAVGVLLSGGIDSGSVAAVAAEEQAAAGGGPLPTFSGVGPDAGSCVETRAIHAAMAMPGLDPHRVPYHSLGDLLPPLQDAAWGPDEPFDHTATLLWALDLAAGHRGVRALLDGTDGDILLAEGSYLAHLMRRGRWRLAYREAAGRNRSLGFGEPPALQLLKRGVQAWTPAPLWRLRRGPPGWARRRRVENNLRSSLIAAEFAQRVRLAERLDALDAQRAGPPFPNLQQERARAITHPYLTVGLERFQRVAASLGTESRHPFADVRLAAFCASLPGDQTLRDGWPKSILRQAMAGRIPEEIRWRWGKERLGGAFTLAFMEAARERVRTAIEENLDFLREYVDIQNLNVMCHRYFRDGARDRAHRVYEAAHLGEWLRRHRNRPRLRVETA